MPTQDLTPEQKAQIALEALIGEITEATTSKEVGEKYNISTKQVNAWKQQGLEGFKSSFIEEEEQKKIIDHKQLSANIAGLLGNTDLTSTTKVSQSYSIEDVVDKIIKWNDGDNKPKIYLSPSIVQKCSGHSSTDVNKFLQENKERLDKHHQKYRLAPSSNKGSLRGFDYETELGL